MFGEDKNGRDIIKWLFGEFENVIPWRRKIFHSVHDEWFMVRCKELEM